MSTGLLLIVPKSYGFGQKVAKLVTRNCRAIIHLALAILLSGCAVANQYASQQSISLATACLAQVKSSEEYRISHTRLWNFDDSDNASKLSDSKPLTKAEQDALVQEHTKMQECRKVILEHDNKYVAWKVPYEQEFYQRADVLFYKLASGEIPVGLANRLIIENRGKYQVDLARAHAEAVSIEEARRQRTSEALIQAGTQMMATSSQSHVSTTNCSWVGNNLNCFTSR